MKILFVIVAAIMLAAPAYAVSPYDLFFRSETDAMLRGGGDVPDDITGRPDLRHPTSLLHAERPMVRLDLCSQTPVELVREGEAVGRWRSDIATLSAVMPLQDGRWSAGLYATTIDDSVWYESGDQEWRLDLDEQRWGVGVAYQVDPTWRAGISCTSGELTGSAGGAALAEMLSLTPGDERWPGINSDSTNLTLGASGTSGPWQFGAQHNWSEPDATLSVRRDVYDYAAPMQLSGHGSEAWVSYHQGRDRWWASWRESCSSGEGTIMLGVAGRGDTSADLHDRSVAIGWRHEADGQLTQLQIDRRDSSFATYDQGYAGVLPGLTSDIYTLRAGASSRINSLRIAHQRHLWRSISVAAAASAHYADVEADLHIRRVPGFATPPITNSEVALDGGRVKLWALTLGIIHEDERLRASLSGTAGIAETNEAFDSTIEGGDGDGGGGSLKVRPLFTAALEWTF